MSGISPFSQQWNRHCVVNRLWTYLSLVPIVNIGEWPRGCAVHPIDPRRKWMCAVKWMLCGSYIKSSNNGWSWWSRFDSNKAPTYCPKLWWATNTSKAAGPLRVDLHLGCFRPDLVPQATLIHMGVFIICHDHLGNWYLILLYVHLLLGCPANTK